MKIVYVSRSIIPSRTANSINVMKMCEAFTKLGHDITLLAPLTKKLEEKNIEDIFDYYGIANKFTFKKLYSPNIKYLKKRIYSLRCFNIIKTLSPDLVYGRDDMLCFYLSKKNGYKTIFEKHGPLEKKERFNNYFFNKFVNLDNFKMITNSQGLKDIYVNEEGINSNTILVANNGTNESDDLLPNYNFNKNKIQVGYVGSLFKGRGIEVIIELASRIKNADFHIIGGDDKDINYWKSNSTAKNLIFHGFIEPKNAYKYRNMCDILLAPYQKSNATNKYMSPIKLFEYMSSKKAIVCSDFNVVRSILNDDCLIFADPSDICQWEKSVNNLINDKNKREKLSKNAYKLFLNEFTWQARAEKIFNFIE